MKILNRELYFKQIEPFIGDSLVKVLIGQRRVGKSHLLKQIKDKVLEIYPSTQIIYINKEEYQFKKLIHLRRQFVVCKLLEILTFIAQEVTPLYYQVN